MTKWVSALAAAATLVSAPLSVSAADYLTISVSGSIRSGYDGPSYFTGDRRYHSLAGYDFRFDVVFDVSKGVISNDYRSFTASPGHGGTATMLINNRVMEMSGLDSAGYHITDTGMYVDFQDNLYDREGRMNSYFRINYDFDGRAGPQTIEDDVFMLHHYGDSSASTFERTDSFYGDTPRLSRFFAGGPLTITVKGITRRAPTPEEPPTTAVPEPATWALMIMGFGLAGAGLRRRHAVTA